MRPVHERAALEGAELSTEKQETPMSNLFETHLKNTYYIKSESFSARNESVGLPWWELRTSLALGEVLKGNLSMERASILSLFVYVPTNACVENSAWLIYSLQTDMCPSNTPQVHTKKILICCVVSFFIRWARYGVLFTNCVRKVRELMNAEA
jgi:hypothetical protein